MGRQNLYEDNAGKLPILKSKYINEIRIRTMALNCLNSNYSDLWKKNGISNIINVNGVK